MQERAAEQSPGWLPSALALCKDAGPIIGLRRSGPVFYSLSRRHKFRQAHNLGLHYDNNGQAIGCSRGIVLCRTSSSV